MSPVLLPVLLILPIVAGDRGRGRGRLAPVRTLDS